MPPAALGSEEIGEVGVRLSDSIGMGGEVVASCGDTSATSSAPAMRVRNVESSPARSRAWSMTFSIWIRAATCPRLLASASDSWYPASDAGTAASVVSIVSQSATVAVGRRSKVSRTCWTGEAMTLRSAWTKPASQ